MKSKLLSAFLLLTLNSFSQGNCVPPPLFASSYEDDINALAVQYMLTTADSDLISIPQVYPNDIGAGMAAVFNSGIPEADSVFRMYCVHAPWEISLCKSWLILFDATVPWTTAWQNTQTVTGNPQVDTLFAAHSLYVDQYFHWSFADAVVVQTTNNSSLNYDALCDSLQLITGINSCESNALIGTAGIITFVEIANIRHYEFTYEWNDCFDGCDNRRTWSFDVDVNCNVTFTGAVDWWALQYEPLPAPTGNCLATGIDKPESENTFEIFPNPFSNKLLIKYQDFENASLRILDVTGREIIATPLDRITSEFNLAQLAAGIYLIEIYSGEKSVVKYALKN